VNWCFTQAVGTSLPSTFWSYPQSAIKAIASQSQDTNAHLDTSLLSFGTTAPTDDYAPPAADTWLAGIGADAHAFNQVTETLAATEYDETPSVQAGNANKAQSPYNVATIPSSRLKRSVLDSLPQRAFLLSSSLQRHRFEARHKRLTARHQQKRDAPNTPEQGAMARGYSDGWKAAKTFAAFKGSRLGGHMHDMADDRLFWSVRC
jgi:hypothetical protein